LTAKVHSMPSLEPRYLNNDLWPYLVTSWPWPLTFCSQNLASSSLSRPARKLHAVRYRVHKPLTYDHTRTPTHGRTDSLNTECLAWLIAGEGIKI